MNFPSTDPTFYKILQDKKADIIPFVTKHYLPPVEKGLEKDKDLMEQLEMDNHLSDWKVFIVEALSAAIVKLGRQIKPGEEEKIRVSDLLVREVAVLLDLEYYFSKLITSLKLGIEKLCNEFEQLFKAYFDFDFDREKINWLYFALYCLQRAYKHNQKNSKKKQEDKMKTHLAYEFVAIRKAEYEKQLSSIVEEAYSSNPLLHSHRVREAFNLLVRKAIKQREEEAAYVKERLVEELSLYYRKKESNELDYQIIREFQHGERISAETTRHLFEHSKKKFVAILSKKFEKVFNKVMSDLYDEIISDLYENVRNRLILTDSNHLIGLKATLDSYLIGIGRNKLANKNDRVEELSDKLLEVENDNTDAKNKLRLQILSDLLSKKLNDLEANNTKHYELIELKYLENFLNKEIAAITDYTSDNSVKVTLFKIRQKLKKAMSSEINDRDIDDLIEGFFGD
ncbi:MAG: hypothetical protein MI974_20865 [Chitinophagales bacterium]|nr:hypothetical protein [Chitinophagales bacterium]